MPETTTDTSPLPMDWHAWRSLWAAWAEAHRQALGATCTHQWPRANFLSDGLLGRWHIDGRCIELSEVTFHMGPESMRGVGVSTLAAAGGPALDPDGSSVVDNLAELEALLWVF